MLLKYIKKNWYTISVFAILLISALIRFYQLGLVPHGMTWDEAAIGYNGFALFNTRRDEWLVRFPVSFMSFGDFKAPLAIYANGFFTYIFGMNLFAVRLPFTIASIFAILGMILLTKEVFKYNKLGDYYSLFAGFIMMLSPWHIHYSRAGFESGMALTFVVWGIYLLLKTINNKFKNHIEPILSASFFVASIYTYHSAKVVVPLIGLTILYLYFNDLKNSIKKLIIPLFVFIGGLVPFINDSLYGEGLTRAGVTIFSSDINITKKILFILNSFNTHLSPNFLLFGDTTTLRHGTGYLGVIFITTYILLIFGLISFFFIIKIKANLKYQSFFILLIIWGILPAAIAKEIPHSNRALLALPGIIITALFGFNFIINKLDKSQLNIKLSKLNNGRNIIKKSFIGILLSTHVIFGVSFISDYFNKFNSESTDAFNDGYLEAFEIAESYEDGDGVFPVEKILFTSKYGQPYIYALFVRETNPIWYRGGSLIKYEFTSKIDINDLNRNNTLVVGSGTDDLPTKKADHVIYGADGSVRFQIFRTR